jgi:quercetin dioxygenase-like cupin family protein
VVEKTAVTTEREAFELLKSEGYGNLYVWKDPPGAFYDWHTHPEDEVRLVLRGEITIGTENGVFNLAPGDKLSVPAGTRHWARVGGSGVVYVCGTKVEGA